MPETRLSSSDWLFPTVPGREKLSNIAFSLGYSGIFSEEVTGVTALYSYGVWLVIVTGWSLFISVVIIMEITRGS